MTRIPQNNCIGMDSSFRRMWMALRRKERLSSQRTECGASPSSRVPPVSVSTTRTIGRVLISMPDSTVAKLGRFLSSRSAKPGNYDREVFLVLKEFEPSFSQGGDMAQDFLTPATRVKGLRSKHSS